MGGNDGPFKCMGDWNTTPVEIDTTAMMGSLGAVLKTAASTEFTCSSCNRLLDCALVDRKLESVVTVERVHTL